MSRCLVCERKSERPSPHADRTHEYADLLIKPLRYVAERHGYALAVHGSLNYDIDLVACPWRDGCTSPESVAEAIRAAAEVIIGLAFIAPHEEKTLPTKKPHGRLAWSFHLGGGPYIDLSVMATAAAGRDPLASQPHEAIETKSGEPR